MAPSGENVTDQTQRVRSLGQVNDSDMTPSCAARGPRLCTGDRHERCHCIREGEDFPRPLLHLVSWTPGAKVPRDHGVVGIANPDYTRFADTDGTPLPWHHTVRKAKDGTPTPWAPMGVCAARDGSVYVETIAPFTLLRYTPKK